MGDFEKSMIRETTNLAAQGEEDGDRAANVLFQLVLPVVMILAILVNQVPTLKRQFDQLVYDVAGTPTERLRNELDIAVLTLQHQLLLQATDQIVEDERSAIGLAGYGEALPSPANLAKGVVSDSFRQTSTAVAERFNGPARKQMRRRLLEQVESRFEELANPHLGSFEPGRQERLLAISAENRAFFETKLEGHLGRIELAASNTQNQLLLAWLGAPPSERVKRQSAEIWVRIAAGETDLVRKFDDLKVIDFFAWLSALGIPMLETVEEAVL